MCNKILWLDHGKQIAFTDEVELYCDAYEEFLYTKKLPQSRADVDMLAQAFVERKQAEREKAQEKEIMKLQSVIEKGEKEEAIQAALNVLRKNRPELLKEENSRIKSVIFTIVMIFNTITFKILNIAIC